jgi:hypothetical protein
VVESLPGFNQEGSAVGDWIVIGILAVFFAVTIRFVAWCDTLR